MLSPGFGMAPNDSCTEGLFPHWQHYEEVVEILGGRA
jgi:hypothetical protein